jgi:hypothetical protein
VSALQMCSFSEVSYWGRHDSQLYEYLSFHGATQKLDVHIWMVKIVKLI